MNNIGDILGVIVLVEVTCVMTWGFTSDYYDRKIRECNNPDHKSNVYNLAYDLFRDLMDRPIPMDATLAAKTAIDAAERFCDTFSARLPK